MLLHDPIWPAATLYQLRQTVEPGRTRAPKAPSGPPPPHPRRQTLRAALAAPTSSALQPTRDDTEQSPLAWIEVQEQLRLAAATQKRRQRLGTEVHDDHVWITTDTFAAWTVDGRLVAIREPSPQHGRQTHRVTLISVEQRRILFQFDVLAPTVIALYAGDSLTGSQPVTRFVWDYRLEAAHRAARLLFEAEQREIEERERERRRLEAAEREPEPPVPKARILGRPKHRKTRFHPDGNFVVMHPVAPDHDLPPFAVTVPLMDRKANRDRQHAKRAIERVRRAGLCENLVAVRVLGAVDVRPRFRKDVRLPRGGGARLEMLRLEPRIVEVEMDVAWLPRFRPDEFGRWTLEELQHRAAVPVNYRRRLLREVQRKSVETVHKLDAMLLERTIGYDALRNPTDQRGDGIDEAFELIRHAERRLPAVWREQLGIAQESLGPDWRAIAAMREGAPSIEDAACGHWLRATHEHAVGHRSDGEKRPAAYRLVELCIDDLPGLVELAGWSWTFWLIKDSTSSRPRWVLPLDEAGHPVSGYVRALSPARPRRRCNYDAGVRA
jgi:hypothetical protein